MEENSVIFAVDSAQCSDDEEDDLQRKEELHQLLSEQLADDLLDDTLSTSMDGDMSMLSTPQYSNSPELSQDKVTPSASPSHDSHMTFPQSTYQYPVSPEGTTPNHLYISPYLTNGKEAHDEIEEVFSHEEAVLLTKSPFKLAPPLPLMPVNDTSDVFAGTSQAYANQSLGLPNGIGAHGQGNPLTGMSHDSQPGSHDFQTVLRDTQAGAYVLQASQSDISTYSDNFPSIADNHSSTEHTQTVQNGYSFKHSNTEHAQTVQNGYSLNEHAYPTEHAQSGLPLSTTYARSTPSHLTHSSDRLEQLEILYDARGRQINQLTQQLSASAEDSERHIRILRHEKLLVETERGELTERLEQLESANQVMEETMATTQGQLSAEKVKSAALEANKTELISRLQASEATVNSLTKQVNELTSSDTLSRIRDNYSQALNAAAHEHKQELFSVQKEAEEYRGRLEEQDAVISELEHHLKELESHTQSQPPPDPHPHKLQGDGSREHSIVQQLEYESEGCEGVRVVELVGRVEDLTFQLTTTQDELQQARERASLAESELKVSANRLTELELERSQLAGHVTTLQTQLEEFKVQAEAEKKAALEHCRSACLKLHEDSTQRLKETVDSERHKLTQDSDRHMAQLKSDLATVQEQYVEVCVQKTTLEQELASLNKDQQATLDKARTEWLRDQEVAIREAVGVVKTEWEGLCSKRVESALCEQEHVWQDRLDKERLQSQGTLSGDGDVTRPLPQSQEGAVKEAVRLARIEWLKEKETSLAGRVESAVCAAQKLWKEQHMLEMDQLKKQFEAEAQGQRSCVPEPTELGKLTEASVAKAKQDCEQQYIVKLQEALTVERAKWELVNTQKWEEREQELIVTAHKEWSVAQDTVTATEVERSKQEWEESQKQKTQAAVQEAILKAKRHYEGVVKKLHSELAGKFEAQKTAMKREIRQLEDRVALLLKEREQDSQQTQANEQNRLECTRKQVEGRQILAQQTCQQPHGQQMSKQQQQSEQSDSQTCPPHSDALRGLLKDTAGNVKRDVLQLLSDELEAVREAHREELARTREETAQQVKQYYLQCLHQLVNSKSHDRQPRSHDHRAGSHDPCKQPTHSSQVPQSHNPSSSRTHSTAPGQKSRTIPPSKHIKHTSRELPHTKSQQASTCTQGRPHSSPSRKKTVADKSKFHAKNGMSHPKGTLGGTQKRDKDSEHTSRGSKRNLFGTTSTSVKVV